MRGRSPGRILLLFDLNLVGDFADEGTFDYAQGQVRATQKTKGAGWMPAPLSCLYI
jgi:hypothetical protein